MGKNKKAWPTWYNEPDLVLTDSSRASPVVSLLCMMLRYGRPTQAKWRFLFTLSRHIQAAGQDSIPGSRGFGSGEECCGSCVSLVWFTIWEGESPGSKIRLQVPPVKGMGVGDRFLFKPLECFFLALEVKICFIKYCLSLNEFCSNKNWFQSLEVFMCLLDHQF